MSVINVGLLMSETIQKVQKIGSLLFGMEPQAVALDVQWIVEVIGKEEAGTESLWHGRVKRGTPLGDGVQADVRFQCRSHPVADTSFLGQ